MIYVPFSHLSPGMVLARSVTFNSALLPLLAVGQRLTDATIRRLHEFGIPGAYIESEFAGDLSADDLIEPEVRQELTNDLKAIYKNYVQQKSLSPSATKSLSNMVESLLASLLSKNACMLNIIQIKDYDGYTYTHSLYVATLSILIGIQLGGTRSSIANLGMAGLLHDIGKLEIPLSIVNKAGPLTEEEFEIMKGHPTLAVQRLNSSFSVPSVVLRGVESHHEKYDGKGYPRGLEGKSIPQFGRILALADVYDALTSTRSYRRAWYSDEAIEYIMGGAGTHFDHEILQSFLKTVSAYPVGTVVNLSDDSLAVVIENTPENTLRPIIRIILPEERRGEEINLTNDRGYYHITISSTVTDSTTLPADLFS